MQYYGNNYMFDNGSVPNYIEAKPWPRFWARLLDYLLCITAFGFIYSKVSGIELTPGTSLWLNIAAMACWVPVEALLLCILGTTPGKWLTNIVVRDEFGKKPGFAKALKRSLLVWICGTFAGIPVISVIGLVSSFMHLDHNKTTIWDKKAACSVTHNYQQPLKSIIVLAIISGITISQYMMPNQNLFSLDEWYKSMLSVYNDNNDINGSYSSHSKASAKNTEAEELMEEGKYDDAEKLLSEAMRLNPGEDDRDAIFNNLSLVYYYKEDYLKSLDYIERALKTVPNTSVEYSNYGNVLYCLERNEEAEDAYIRSSHFDDETPYCHYGLGLVNYNRYEYTTAQNEFLKYTKMEENDADGWIYLGLSCLYGEKDTVKAKEYLEKALELAPEYADAVDAMAIYYDYTGATEKAKEMYSDALSKSPDDYDLLCKAAEYHYYNGSPADAIKYADQAISKNNVDYDAYKIKANSYFSNEDKQKAEETIEEMLSKHPDDPIGYDLAGDILFDAYEYKLATEYYQKALDKNPMNINAQLGIIGSLYHRKRYADCLSYALEAQKKFNDTNILWYIGDAYSGLNDSENAISYYEKALEKDPQNPSIILSIGWENFYKCDFVKALEYANKALEIDSSSYSAKNLKETTEKRQGNLAEQIGEFIEDNYMYFRPNDEFSNVREKLKGKEQPSTQDILELFAKAYKEGDMFSFVLYDDYYRQYVEMSTGSTVESKIIDHDIIYAKISSFSENTANEFLNVIDNTESPENKYLVIDLRGNGGGDTNSGCNILDYLLADCVICNLIYKDGYSDSYYSDDEYIEFKHIFVLTDGNSASCSELVTLGLKTYLDNVTVIGAKTFGKGVGQIGYDDKNRNLALFIVNHFWNVREINIMDKGIEPDVPVEGSGDEECMSEVRRLIAGQAE